MADDTGVDLDGVEPHSTQKTERITADCATERERRFRDAHEEFCRKWDAIRGTDSCPLAAPSTKNPFAAAIAADAVRRVSVK